MEEGIDAPAETRTLLKAFSDYVEKEDFDDEASRAKPTRWWTTPMNSFAVASQ